MWDAGERVPHGWRPWDKLAQQSMGCTDALCPDGRPTGGIEADVSCPCQAHRPVIGLDANECLILSPFLWISPGRGADNCELASDAPRGGPKRDAGPGAS